jgi:hypothetical protein
MRYMNDYDLYSARSRFARADTPHRLALAEVVDNLREETDQVSDGWAYWPKPARAADKAMALIESRTSRENDEQERTDITEAEMLAAVKPIKAFLTRHKDVYSDEARERILRWVTV